MRLEGCDGHKWVDSRQIDLESGETIVSCQENPRPCGRQVRRRVGGTGRENPAGARFEVEDRDARRWAGEYQLTAILSEG